MNDLKYSAYIFDLDGTLTDSHYAIGQGVIRAMKIVGIKDISIEDVKRWIGRPLAEIFPAYAREYGIEIDLNEELMDKMVQAYREGHDDHFPQGITFYPRVKETLEYLRSKGALTAIATTKYEEAAHFVMDGIGLSPYVDVICGTDRDKPVKPDPFVINLALERLKVKANQAVVIGDTAADVLAAHGAGCHAVAVTYGFGNLEKIKLAKPEYIIDSLENLPK